MNRDQWQKIRPILERALELSPAQRPTFLDRECAGDTAFRDEIESLIAAAETRERGFLENVGANVVSELSRDAEFDDAVDGYRLLHRIGEGGMGEVWLAEQQQPVRRRVALKVLKWGLGSKEVLARFRREQQALALMDHECVARVFTAGMSQRGRPFFVMEYIEGIAITEYCDRHALPIEERLRLFQRVCDGVQHAHQRGIIHRDIKPANILVCVQDDRPLPKVIDFGVARAVRQPLADQTAYTHAGSLIGTPHYMSPEQAGLTTLNVDTRSDVYSLGVVLYELLAGALPHERRTSGTERLDDLRRRIQTEEPPAPSERISRSRDAESIATSRATTPDALSRKLSGPLDRILARALSKDRTRRYSSPDELSADIGRFVEGQRIASWSGSRSTPGTRMALLVALVTLVVGAGVGWFVGRQARDDDPSWNFRELTHSGQDYSPAVSPDGQLIAFASDRGGSSRIFLVHARTGDERLLTDGPDFHPRFSPDGTKVSFSRYEDGTLTLHVVPLLGGSPRPILDNALAPDWSPDGTSFVFLRKGADDDVRYELAIAQATGAAVRPLVRLPRNLPTAPRWSPDGRRIALTGYIEGPPYCEIFLVDLESPTLQRLEPAVPGRLCGGLTWLDKNHIAYLRADTAMTTHQTSPGRLVSHDVISGDTRTLVAVRTVGLRPLVDESGIVFVETLVRTNAGFVYDSSSTRVGFRQVGLPGSALPPVKDRATVSSDRQLSYSPDGGTVLFSSDRAGGLDLWTESTTTGEVRRITDHPDVDWDPSFSPDGEQILWSSNRSGDYAVWIADRDGSNPRQVTFGGPAAQNPVLSPVGTIFYWSIEGLWMIPANGGAHEQVCAGYCRLPKVSPDGRYMAHAMLDGDGRSIAVRQTADHQLIDYRLRGAISPRCAWSADGTHLAYFTAHPEGGIALMLVPFVPEGDGTGGGTIVARFPSKAHLDTFALHPTEPRVAVGVVNTTSQVVALER